MINKITIVLILFLMTFFSASICTGQGFPSANETPFSNKAKGFVQATLGLSLIPYIDISSTEHNSGDILSSEVRNSGAIIPGRAAGLAFIPVFSDNGVLLEVSYSLNGVEFDHDINVNGTNITSPSTTGFGIINFNVGYVRYFLEGPYHIYFNIIPGFQMITARTTTNFDGEKSISSSDKFNNISISSGFGFFKEVMAGGLGLELRGEYSILESEFSFDDPYGKADYMYTHPIQIKLLAVFLLGGI